MLLSVLGPLRATVHGGDADDTPLLRRARLHTRALEVLGAEADAAELARHASAAAGPATAQQAIRYPVAAARAAERAGSWREAAAQWRDALRLRELAGSRATGTAVELTAPAVTAHARAGDSVRARAIYLTALDAAAGAGARQVRGTAGPLSAPDRAHPAGPDRLRPASGTAWPTSAPDRVHAAGPDWAGTASGTAGPLPDLALLTAWDAPLIWTTRDGRAPSHTAIAAIRAHLATELPDDTRVRLLLALFRELEGYDEADGQRVSAAALAPARTVPDPALRCAALNVRAYAALGPDLRAERRPVAEEYLAAAVAAGRIDHEAVAHWLLFLDAAAHTDLAGARAEMELAVTRSTTGQLGILLAVVAIFSALLELLAGRVDAALHALFGDPAYARSAAELTARLRTPAPPDGGTAPAGA
ncbi:hypothetical protein [Nocardia sp. NPDC057353]|uniref:hypothetical protein n=1 Tax=Nocardia sp. NPDC057353 TaxID=3346104 RepID=UPI0036442E9C